MTVTIETLPYVLVHGHAPRGRKSWAFCPFHMRDMPLENKLNAAIITPELTYKQAEKYFREELVRLRNIRRAADLPVTPWNVLVWALLPEPTVEALQQHMGWKSNRTLAEIS